MVITILFKDGNKIYLSKVYNPFDSKITLYEVIFILSNPSNLKSYYITQEVKDDIINQLGDNSFSDFIHVNIWVNFKEGSYPNIK